MEIDEAIERIDKICKTGKITSDADYTGMYMAIEALKFQKEYQAKVQKCIERIKDMSGVQYDCDKCGAGWEVTDCIYTKNAIEIIKEEMGVEESESSSIHEANQNS